MKKLRVQLRRSPEESLPVGTLVDHDRRIYFEYDPAFLESGLELSPFKLPLRPGLIEHTDFRFGPLPGLFDDSLPDGWGLLLMDRYVRRQGLDPATFSPLDRLSYLGTRTMGALTYHPSLDIDRDDRLLDLHALGRNAEEVLTGKTVNVLPELLRAGGSPGGARPKVLVGLRGGQILSGEDDLPEDFEHWMVKFAVGADIRDGGPVEYAYSRMARAAGIEMPPTRLLEVKQGRSLRRHFAVQRFDRGPSNHRTHVHTLANMVHADFRVPSADYVDLFKVARSLTRNHTDVLRLFRLMAFNVAAHNRDDHAKNFAFRLDDRAGQWSLAPAYDLTFSPGPGGEHSTTLLGEGRQPVREHCLLLAERVEIKREQATRILDEVSAAVARWRECADEACCTRTTAALIASAVQLL